jgi:hypothetical protein
MDKIRPCRDRIQELKGALGLNAARRLATREALIKAVHDASSLDDIKRIILTMMDLA